MTKYAFLITLSLLMCLSCIKQKEENHYKTSLRECLMPQIERAYNNNDWNTIILLSDSLKRNGEKYDDVVVVYGESLMALGKADEAIEILKQELKKKNSHTPKQYLYHEMGNAYQILDDDENAIICYEKALDLNPNYARPYIHLAEIYVQQGNQTKAKENYLNACYLFDQNHFYKEELEYGRRAWEIDSTCEEALHYMANGYAGLGLK